MGEDKNRDAEPVASDYSGRPIDRPTAEAVAADGSHFPAIDAIAYELPDGRTAIMGYGEDGDSYGFYLPDKDGWADYDRPVDPDTGELLTPSRDADKE